MVRVKGGTDCVAEVVYLGLEEGEVGVEGLAGSIWIGMDQIFYPYAETNKQTNKQKKPRTVAGCKLGTDESKADLIGRLNPVAGHVKRGAHGAFDRADTGGGGVEAVGAGACVVAV